MVQHILHEGIDISKSCFYHVFFLDSLIFFTFVQNNCCGAKLKAISCRYNMRNFLSIDLFTSLLQTTE